MKIIEINKQISSEHKEFMVSFFRDIFHACFWRQLNDCKTYQEVRQIIFQNAENIGDYLDLPMIDEAEQDEKDVTISILEQEIDDLQYKLSKYESGTLLDEWKGEILQSYIHKYTPLELEAKLKN